MSNSSAPSIDSSLERLNLDDEDPTSENVRLTPIFQNVYSSPSLEPNCSQVPVLSDIPSFPATPATATLIAPNAPPGLVIPSMSTNASST